MILVAAAGIVLVVVVGAGFIRRTPIKIAFRDFRRRPIQSSLIILGLLVASLVIAAAMVAGDSMKSLFQENVFRSWGSVDLRVGSISGKAFPLEVADSIISSPEVAGRSDGFAARLEIRAAVEAIGPRTREPRVGLIGIQVQDRSLGMLGGANSDVENELFARSSASEQLVVINRRFADALQVAVGDELGFQGVSPLGRPFSFRPRVLAIVPNEGKADWSRIPNAFTTLESLQIATEMAGQVNQLLISADGPPRRPVNAKALNGVIERLIGSNDQAGSLAGLQVVGSKDEDLRQADETSEFFRSLLQMLGGIVAVTSIALIINLFVMLGEERRSELGTMRALGLRRNGLVLVGLTEGVLYAVGASLIGALTGGLLGRYIGDAMADIFRSFAASAAIEFARPPFSFSPRTWLTAAGAGFLVTVGAVAFVSVKTSRLTVVAAIRGLPEERVRRRRRIPWVAIAVALTGLGFLAVPGMLRAIGGALLALGLGAILAIYWKRRAGTTLGAFAALAWGLWVHANFDPNFDANPGTGFAFIAGTGMVTVIAAVILFSSNLTILGRLTRFLGRAGGPTVKTAAAYASGNRFKTAMSIAMFAFVLYMIAGFAVWGSFGSADFEKESGGFQVFARATVPIDDLQVAGASDVVPLYAARYELGYRIGDSAEINAPAVLYGIGPEFVKASRFKFSKNNRGETDRETWERVLTTPFTAVVDRGTSPGETEIGDLVQLKSDQTVDPLHVVGVADEFVFNAIFMSKETFRSLYSGRAANTVWLIRLEAGISPEQVVRSLENDHASAGLDAANLRTVFDEAAASRRTFIGLFQLLLKMGLVIGITSLAIAAVRNVIERRHEIGLARALGFRRSMIAVWLIAEGLIVATIGMFIGIGVGVLGSYLAITLQVRDFPFGVEWSQILGALSIVYGAILVLTAVPAYQAAALNPSQAVRYVE